MPENPMSGQPAFDEQPLEQQANGAAETNRVVVAGAGLAAAHLVETLRKEGYDGGITVVGDEATAPYERPPLSKDYLQGKQERDEAIVHDEAWYAEHDVDLVLGETVDRIDRSGHAVTLGSGEVLPYGHLVLATGAQPRKLSVSGADLPGVHALRRLEDSDSLREAFGRGGRIAIVGAGWIGLEVASSARQAGMEVTVVAPGSVPLGKVMGQRVGRHFAELHRANGVELRLGSRVELVLERGGRAAGLVTDDGVVEADLVLAAVGAVPDTRLAEAAGLEVDGGVVVDARLRTADPHILAAGDVAKASNTLLGKRLRVEHWDNAIRQGKLAALSILGRDDVYDWQPYFFTDQFDLGMEYVGHAGPEAEPVFRGDPASGEFIVFWLEGGTVTAAMNVNIWDVNETLRGIVGRKVPAGRLSDPAVELGEL